MQRYFAKEKLNDCFILEDSDYYHIRVVMRMKDLDEIVVIYNSSAYLCYLQNVSSDMKVFIKEEMSIKESKIPFVRLVIPALKEQKMDYIFQKATELGVSEFVLYEAKRSVEVPNIIGIKKLEELCNLDGVKLVCSTREKTENIKKLLKNVDICAKMNVVIGPEGGLEEQEEKRLEELEFIPITLGNRIMRVETVPLFMMSVINYEYME